jgi:hypothetical protein
MDESELLVQLSGESSELDELGWWGSQSNFSLYNVVKIDNMYYLKSPRFTQKEDAGVTYQKAEQLLPIIKAFAKIHGLGAQSIAIGGTVYQGGQRSLFAKAGKSSFYVIGEFLSRRGWFWKKDGKLYFRGWQNGKVIEIGHEPYQVAQEFADTMPELDALVQKGLQLDSELSALEKCINDPYVYEAFFYFAKEPSWYNLYNTYEMIKFDVDKTLKEHNFDKKVCNITGLGWAEPNELKKFKRAANDPEAEGTPRHSTAYYRDQKARKREKKGKSTSYWEYKETFRAKRRKNDPSRPQLMRLFDADALITRIFRGWCKWKARQCQLKTHLHYGELAARSIEAYMSSSSHSSKNHSGR